MKFSADKILEMTNGKGGSTLAGTATQLLKRRIWFIPKTRLFTDCPSDLVSDSTPKDCPSCNGQMEWTGEYDEQGHPKAHCNFCGLTVTDTGVGNG